MLSTHFAGSLVITACFIITAMVPGVEADDTIINETYVINSEAEYHGFGLSATHQRAENYTNPVIIPNDWVTFSNVADFYDDFENAQKRKIEIYMHVNDDYELKYSQEYESLPFDCSVTMDMMVLVTSSGGNPEEFTIKTQYVLYEWQAEDWVVLGDQTCIESAYVVKVQGQM